VKALARRFDDSRSRREVALGPMPQESL